MPTDPSASTHKDLITRQRVSSAKKSRSRELRHEMTPAESKLWSCLRTNRLEGYHFRRQQVIEPYIVDFYCHKAGLVVEVDGGIHQEQEEYDQDRDQNLQALGLRVLHFSNTEVNQTLEKVLDSILQACRGETYPLPPSLKGKGK